jgi:anthranilate phosphoribosyltransferase
MIQDAIKKVAEGVDLTEEEMIGVMTQIGEGRADPVRIGALIMGLRMKGETVDEIVGAVRVLRGKRTKVARGVSGPLVDTCGTGGDGAGGFNVSTTAAFVAAGCGVAVAKHGNRRVSSRCGSADLLEALGVDLNLTPQAAGECLTRIGLTFLFAPNFHPAMRHAVLPRRQLGLKSIFNLLGPLTNPAGANVQVIGVYSPKWTEHIALVLNRLGCKSAFVVHGEEGLDEISVSGPTLVARVADGAVDAFRVAPEDLGLTRSPAHAVQGGDAAFNADLTRRILNGEPGPPRDMVLANAAAALVAAGAAPDLAEGVRLAASAIDDGRAKTKLDQLVAVTNELGGLAQAVA